MTISKILIALTFAAAIIIFYYLIKDSFSIFALSVWLHALISGVRLSLVDIVQLQLQGVKNEDILKLLECIIMASKADVSISLQELNSHRHIGGNIFKVTKAMIAANKANIPMAFDQATAIDLAKLDILEAIQKSVNPVICDTPEIIAKAKDGLELKVHCRVTLRANVNNYMKGADQRTILGRVGEGVVSAIGSAENHQEILANPYQISDYIMTLDRDNDGVPDVHQNTAFIVTSIDVTDINLGENVAVRHAIDRAEAEAKKAQADSEGQRANAVKREEEMKNRITEMRAKLLESEAEIPLAIADALKNRNSEQS